MKITKDNFDQVIGEITSMIKDQLDQGLEGEWEGRIHQFRMESDNNAKCRRWNALQIGFPISEHGYEKEDAK